MTQSSKNVVLTLVGLAVAAGLAAYAYFGVLKGEEEQAQQKEISDRVFSAAATTKKSADGGTADIAFTRIEVKAKGDHTLLEKRDGGWWLTGAFNAPADEFAVDGISSQLQTAKFKAKLEEKPTPDELKKYGLSEPPRFSVFAAAKMPDGTVKKLQLHGGIDNPFDGSVYMRRDDDPAVYTAEGGLRWSLEKSTFDLRDKQVLAFDEPDIQRIRVKTGAGEYILERDDKKAWLLKAPISSPADGSAVTSMLASLRGERAQAFLPDSLFNRQKVGLETPDVDATVTMKTDKGTEEVRVRIARGDADAGNLTFVLVERPDSGVFAQVSAGAIAAFDKAPDQLKDKSLVKFDPNAAAKLTISPGAGASPVVLERKRSVDGGMTESWELTAPERGDAKAFKVAAFMYSLTSAKAATFVAQKPTDWKTVGIDDKASMTVMVEDAAGKPLVQLVRGNEVPDNPGRVYVRSGGDTLAEVDATKFSEMPVQASEFLSAVPATDAGTKSSP